MKGYAVSQNEANEGGGYFLSVWFDTAHHEVAVHNLKIKRVHLQTVVRHLLWSNYRMPLETPHRVSIAKGAW